MKKILVISASPTRTDTNMGKTLGVLLSKFKREELDELYFNPESPNIYICSSYYQICEKQMIKSLFGILGNCGGIILPKLKGKNTIKAETNPLILTKFRRNILMQWGRELVWNLTNWKKKNFIEWIATIKPNVIFMTMQDVNAATKSIIWIAKNYNLPVVLFITDDFYNDHKRSKNILRKLYYKERQLLNRELAKYCTTVIGCSEKAANYFSNELNIQKKEVLYTPSADVYLKMPYKQYNKGPVKIRYFGNLGLGRWKILKELGKVVKKINENQKLAVFEIYSSLTDRSIIKELNIENGCEFKGWVYGEEYLSLLQDTDIAVHVESFDEDMIRRTWVSISTKIADYLGAGKCILAIGSKELASIDHIKDVACIVDNLNTLEEKLLNLISNPDLREKNQEKARSLALKFHNREKICEKVKTILNRSKDL